MRWFILAVIGLVCYVGAEENVKMPTTIEEALNRVNELGSNFPGAEALQGLNASQLPIREVEQLLKQKCEKNGPVGSYETAKQGAFELGKCVSGLVDIKVLQDEMEKARPTGDLDEVFKKYCRKKPILKSCMTNFTTALEPCLEPKERENKVIVQNITEKILNFICFKEGDRIALFIAAKGPECFQSKSNAIQECVNATYGKYLKDLPSDPAQGLASLTDVKTLPSLTFDDKACRDMDKLQSCVVAALEGCDDPTPANLLDSIFNYIKKVTPCEKMLGDMPVAQAQVMERSSASRNLGLAAVIIAALVVVLS